MKSTIKGVIVILELVLATLVALWGLFLLWCGLFYETSGMHPATTLLEGSVFLLATAALLVAAWALRGSPHSNQLVHLVALAAAFLVLRSGLGIQLRLDALRLVVFVAGMAVSIVGVASVAALATRNPARGLALLGITLAGLAFLALLFWLAAYQAALNEAGTLLMMDPYPYFPQGFVALRRAVLLGLAVGVVPGGCLVWIQRRAK